MWECCDREQAMDESEGSGEMESVGLLWYCHCWGTRNHFCGVVWPAEKNLISRDRFWKSHFSSLSSPSTVITSSVHQHHLMLLNNLGLKVPLGPLFWPPPPVPPLFLPGLMHKPCCWLNPSSIPLGLPCTPAHCLSALVCLGISCTALLSTISVSTRTYLEQGTLITTWF